jgi:hypothetical protein
MQPAEFKAVPFDDRWINHDKIDVHAIYRRPVLDEVGEQRLDAHGVPQWDYTGGIPVRRHLDWTRKGFEYVTLADLESLHKKLVVQFLAEQGLKPAEFVMLRNRKHASPWNPQLYLASQAQRDRAHADDLRSLVERLGSEAVREVLRATKDPNFELPVHLRGIPPGGTVALPTAAAISVTPIRAHDAAGNVTTVTTTVTEAAPAATPAPLPRVAKRSLAARNRKHTARVVKRAAAVVAAAANTEVPV